MKDAIVCVTGVAHGVHKERELNGVYDQHWPQWYAAYLIQHGLGMILDQSVTTEELSRLLKQSDQAYQLERPDVGWPDYYAQRLIAALG
jgi:hypothetical protein